MENKIILSVIVAGVLYVAGQYVGSQPQRIEQEVAANREIQVEGTGKVEVRPDIAQITLGVEVDRQPTADSALRILSERFSRVVAALKDVGVAEEDVTTTNFSISPTYDFPDGRQVPTGFQASENVTVKIRDLDTIGQVISRTTVEGVNQVGGVTFTSEDVEEIKSQAQEAAIADARQKAERLAQALGVRLGRVKTFSSSLQPPIPFLERAVAVSGIGGAEPVPQVPVGTQETTAQVTVTFEIE